MIDVARARFGAFELDLLTGELRQNGSIVPLKPQPTRALQLLVRNAGRLVSREQLCLHLWPDTFVSFDHGLNTCIRQVREALGDHARSPQYVETVARRGYRFVANTTLVQLTGGTAATTVEPMAPARTSTSRWSRWRLMTLALAVTTISGVAWYVFNGNARRVGQPLANADRASSPESWASRDTEAGAAYLKGRYALSHHDPTTARKYLTQAIARDSFFALAHAERTEANLALGDTAAAARDAERATRLAPQLADAHRALGDVAARVRWDWTTALHEYESAIALAPADARFRQRYAYLLSLLGRHGDALREITLALKLDPVSPLVHGDAAWLYLYARRPAEAAEMARATVELSPDFAAAWYCLIMALETQGKPAEARDVAVRVARRYGAHPDIAANILAAKARAGVDIFWRWDLAQMAAHGMGDRYPLDFAAAYSRFRQPDSALVFLERGVIPGAMTAAVIAVDPRFDPLRTAPGFKGILARLHLPPRTS